MEFFRKMFASKLFISVSLTSGGVGAKKVYK